MTEAITYLFGGPIRARCEHIRISQAYKASRATTPINASKPPEHPLYVFVLMSEEVVSKHLGCNIPGLSEQKLHMGCKLEHSPMLAA